MHSPFDLLALLLVLSAGLAVLNCRVLKLPMTVGLLVGAFAGTMGLLGLDAAFPAAGIRAACARDRRQHRFSQHAAARISGVSAVRRGAAGELGRHVRAQMDHPGAGERGHGAVHAHGRRRAAARLAAVRARPVAALVPGVRRADFAHRSGVGARRAAARRHSAAAAGHLRRREPVQRRRRGGAVHHHPAACAARRRARHRCGWRGFALPGRGRGRRPGRRGTRHAGILGAPQRG